MAKGSWEASKTGNPYAIMEPGKWLLFGPRILQGVPNQAKAEEVLKTLQERNPKKRLVIAKKHFGRWSEIQNRSKEDLGKTDSDTEL